MSSSGQSKQQPRHSVIYPNASVDLAAIGSPRKTTHRFSGLSERVPWTPGVEDTPSAIKFVPPLSPRTPTRQSLLETDVPPSGFARNVTRRRDSSFFDPEDSPTAYKTPQMSTTVTQPTETAQQQLNLDVPSYQSEHGSDYGDPESPGDRRGDNQPPHDDKGKGKEPASGPPGGGDNGPGGGGGGGSGGGASGPRRTGAGEGAGQF